MAKTSTTKKTIKKIDKNKTVEELDSNLQKIKKQLVELLMIANDVKEERFDEEYKVIIVVEGHSPASGIRSGRNAKVHGVLALRGKILNVWRRTLSAAMRSDIVKEYLTVIKEERYDKIIYCCDADPDGDHIRTLLLGCTIKFSYSKIKDGIVFNCYTPLYTVHDKKMKLVTWSKNYIELPGCTTKENKGLGSYDEDSIEHLILYPQKGAVYLKFIADDGCEELLNDALTVGCVDWVKIDTE